MIVVHADRYQCQLFFGLLMVQEGEWVGQLHGTGGNSHDEGRV
jgi:hypothetical protein